MDDATVVINLNRQAEVRVEVLSLDALHIVDRRVEFLSIKVGSLQIQPPFFGKACATYVRDLAAKLTAAADQLDPPVTAETVAAERSF